MDKSYNPWEEISKYKFITLILLIVPIFIMIADSNFQKQEADKQELFQEQNTLSTNSLHFIFLYLLHILA